MTRAMGISTRVVKTARGGSTTTSTAVVLDGTQSSPAVVQTFPVTTAASNIADRVYDIASGVRSKLSALDVDVVLIRRADQPPRASKFDGPKFRLLTEGGLLTAARDLVPDSRLVQTQELTKATGLGKDALLAQAQALGFVAEAEAEAAAAALSGLPK